MFLLQQKAVCGSGLRAGVQERACGRGKVREDGSEGEGWIKHFIFVILFVIDIHRLMSTANTHACLHAVMRGQVFDFALGRG